jgi:integrase
MPRPRKPPPKPPRRRRGPGSINFSARLNLWRAQLPRLPDGTRPKPAYFRTREEAEGWLSERLDSKRGWGRDIGNPHQPLGVYLDLWNESRDVSDHTRANGVSAIKAARAIWPIPLGELEPEHFTYLWTNLEKRGLSRRTIAGYRDTLKGALKAPTRRGLWPENPVDVIPYRVSERTPTEHLEPADVERFLAVSDQEPTAAFWRLMLSIGPRPSEVRALQWSDMDLDAGRLTISRNLTQTKREERPTKTRRAREVSLPAATVAALRAHRAAQTVASKWLFPSPLDPRNPCSASWIEKQFLRIRRASRVKPIRLYSLRHTAATWMLNAGWPTADVAAVLGHTPSMCAAVYWQHTPSHRVRIAATMDELLPGFGGQAESSTAVLADSLPQTSQPRR